MGTDSSGLLWAWTESRDWWKKTLDIGKRPGQSSVVFDMPSKDPETARRLKHECI